MCGIAGFVAARGQHNGESILRRLTSAIVHRGPDDSGFFCDGTAFLGHRRLSIIDVAAGHQPMTSEQGTRWIVYNGEIFNHADLRPDLVAAGHTYRTRCDTETILHAWEQYGEECVKRFRGMFAFAAWDQQSRTLFCARDRLGIKPFYYFWNGQVFVFGSEIKALLEHPDVPREPEESLLPEYLAFGYVSDECTLFRGIKKLMPGHSLRLDLSGVAPRLEVTQYWDVPRTIETESRSDEDWIAETRRRLEEAVSTRLMSDVPLGVFLSGGVDSSAIAALVRRMAQGSVRTFSVGYSEQQFSELSYAAHVAGAIGTDHHEVVVDRDSFFSALPRMIWHEDEPISWPSSIPLHYVSKLASGQVKVVLTGEGSDEIFAGYERYRWNLMNVRAGKVWGLVPSAIRRFISRQLTTSPLLRADFRRKLRHTFIGRSLTVESLYLDNFYCAFSRAEQETLTALPPDAVYSNWLRRWNERSGESLVPRMLFADQKTYLVELLMKQDQMSMSSSIESRVPFLDHHLVEFATRIPDNLKIRGGEQKYVLKRAVEDLLPKEIVYRRKMGFPTPLRQWLRDSGSDSLLAAVRDRNGFLASWLNMDAVDSLIQRHRTGLEDGTDRIWRLLNLQIWGDLFFTGKTSHAWAESLQSGHPVS